MRILWINHRDRKHPQAGGAEVHLHEVGKRLTKSGHDVTLLAERFPGSLKEECIDGIRVRRRGGKFSIHMYAPYYVMRYFNMYDIVIDDIAHAVPFWSPYFSKKQTVAIVHHVHQRILDIELPSPLRYLVKRAERSIKSTYSYIIAVSYATKEDLVNVLKVPPERIKVIYHGIDHEVYKPGLKFEEPTALWIGRMKKYKNLDHVVKAFAKVKSSVKDAKLILVGSGPEMPRIRSLIDKIGIDDIELRGRVSEAEKIRLLQRAWVSIYASAIEGWGMGILEAAACATPTVAYDLSVFREAIRGGETGLLIKYGDISSLAEGIKEILTDGASRKKLSRNALKNSRNFNWNKTTFQTERYLQRLTVDE